MAKPMDVNSWPKFLHRKIKQNYYYCSGQMFLVVDEENMFLRWEMTTDVAVHSVQKLTTASKLVSSNLEPCFTA